MSSESGPWQTKRKQLALWSFWILLQLNPSIGKANPKNAVFTGGAQMVYNIHSLLVVVIAIFTLFIQTMVKKKVQ